MGQRNPYTNTTYGDSSGFDSEDSLMLVKMFTENRRAKEAHELALNRDVRADTLQKANIRFGEGQDVRSQEQHEQSLATNKYNAMIVKQTNNQTKAMNSWKTHGLDMGAVLSDDLNVALNVTPGPYKDAWKGYQTSSLANGIEKPDQLLFFQNRKDSEKQLYRIQIGKINALYDEIERGSGGLASAEQINREIEKRFPATDIYNRYHAAGGDATYSKYVPADRKVGIMEKVKSWIKEPDLGETGGKYKTIPMTIGGAAGVAGTVGVVSYGNKFIQDARALSGLKSSDLKSISTLEKELNRFREMQLSTKAKVTPKLHKKLSTKKATLTKKINKMTKKFEKDYPKSGFSKYRQKHLGSTKRGTRAIMTAGGHALGRKTAEQFTEDPLLQEAGGVAGAVGGWKGFKMVSEKLMDPAFVKKITPILKKKAPKLAKTLLPKLIAGAGLAAFPEPVSTAIGVGGLALTAYEIMNLVNEIPEIYEIFAGE